MICAVFSYKYGLVDKPNKRKIHSKPTAYTGGIALSACYIFSLLFFDILDASLNLIISISCLITCVGFIDDKYNLNTGGKLSLQIIPIFYLIIFENLTLSSLGEYAHYNLLLNSFEIPFTLLSVLFLINACNYFDGIDGSLGITSFSVLSILYFLAIDEFVKLFIFIIALPLLLFLFFNFSIFKLPKLFLGDSGSLLLGFILSFILIYFAKNQITHPILLAWSVSLFVYEFLCVNLKRLENKKNLFKPGLDHLHYFILNKTKSNFLTNLYLFVSNIILFTIGLFVYKNLGPTSSLISFLFFFLIFFIIRKRVLCSIN
ncbi:glycosyltransferase family 4 protein [Candidatus Pelagibacter sp. HIMB1495]|uniref:glycosyltransferase family 4 protein n=1 Tax=unclassified Candidatus Pelagibacter TaxID=2647897 RepID=UPI003F8364F9